MKDFVSVVKKGIGKIEWVHNTRVIYVRVRNTKNYFEIPTFLPIERGISRAGKFKVMLLFAATEMCLFV